MTWNYRIVEYADGTGFGLHKVDYNIKGEPVSMTVEPTGFVGETKEDVAELILLARADADARPVFVEPANWE